MDIVKNRFVIKPGSIHVGQKFDLKTGSKSSPFDNNYDMGEAARKLGEKIHQQLNEDDADYDAWQTWKAHELILKQH